MYFSLAHAAEWVAAHQDWALPLAFVAAFTESLVVVSLLVPSTAILVACGALVGAGKLAFWPLLLGAIPGAVLGDGVGYWLGLRFGRRILRAWPLNRSPETVARADAFLRRHGALGVGIGRFFGPARAVVPLLAGIVQLRPAAFWAANALSALIWAPAVVAPGLLAGRATQHLTMGQLAAAGAALGIAALLSRWLWRRRKPPA